MKETKTNKPPMLKLCVCVGGGGGGLQKWADCWVDEKVSKMELEHALYETSEGSIKVLIHAKS